MVVSIFISYSHKDLSFKNELRKHLSPLITEGNVEVWDDYNIEAGENWDNAIKKHLHTAHVILLLVSADALASKYFYEVEVPAALSRHRRGDAVVLPIILRECFWQKTPLSAIECLPEKGRPIALWRSRDMAFTDIAKKIDRLVDERSHQIKLQNDAVKFLKHSGIPITARAWE